MLNFVPNHEIALCQEPLLVDCICTCKYYPSLEELTEKECLWKVQGLADQNWTNVDGMEFPLKNVNDLLLWTPPLCIADVAVKFLRKYRHWRPELTHIIVVSKLMMYKWRKNIFKTCDLSLYVDFWPRYWPTNMHESFLIGVYFPLLYCSYWNLIRSRLVLEVERNLCLVHKDKTRPQVIVLPQFLAFSR